MKTTAADLLEAIFSSEGLLSHSLAGFDVRDEQRLMSAQLLQAYEKKQVALIEAGTGIGKTMAYLVPAVIWALKHQEKTIISTHTISLQEQLIHKDIPFLLKAMDLDLKAVLVKGMGNYLCLRKLKEEIDLAEDPELNALQMWSERTKEGSRSEVVFPLAPSTWEKVNAEADTCNKTHCPHYKSCFFFKARKDLEEAQILVVNHHLLLADLNAKIRKEEGILPGHLRLVLDEAHHLEDIALESLSKRSSRVSLIRLLGKVYSDSHPLKSRLMQIRDALAKELVQHPLTARLEIDLPGEKRGIDTKTEAAFESLESLYTSSGEEKVRLNKEFLEQELGKEISKKFIELSDAVSRFSESLTGLKKDLERLDLKEKLSGHILALEFLGSRLKELADNFSGFFSEGENLHRVRWIEFSRSNTTLVDANLDVSSYLGEHLFDRLSTVALCSATLATAKDFRFMRERLGIKQERDATEAIYDSPFDYANRTLLLVPTDMPLPSDPRFNASACEAILRAIRASRGNAFILFTSYDMLRKCYEEILPIAEKEGFTLLKQGDLSRQLLLESFKVKEGSVLFGTDSFWEGVDVPGEALRCVVIVKLPFKVPDDPMMQAHAELLLKQNKQPFFDYAVPQAVIKFKQGFGRLMRKKTDRGCILCLDQRLVTKNYGKSFLKSLPPCRTSFGTSDIVFKEMISFYKSR